MELEIRHLRVICTVAETGSIGRAAAALRVSQPSLSAQLHRIERMLGGTLFVRRNHGVAPTSFGEMVLTRCRAVLPTIDELSRATTRISIAADPQLLRLGSVNAPLLAGLVTGLRERFPHATITSHGEGSPTPLVHMIAGGLLELAVAGENPAYELPVRPEVTYHTVATEPVFALIAEDHPLAVHDEIDLADLAGECFGLPRPDDDRSHEYYALACLAAGFELHTSHDIEGTPLLDLVRAGHAVTFCQATFRVGPGLAVVPLAGTPLWYRHVLLWHRESPFADHAALVTKLAAATYERAIRRNAAYPAWLARQRTEPPAPAREG
ncbi:LysR family transcriptional regulator [Virgisporangium aurantiacum]|uniref:LysR family transcriptional regulator n=1 Tax=Virgisporangium aurantiacum TaxID=175570 RepID=A0A8J3Z682_9ACTN|nr:LysR family transcriptional regulator [Virgisporangium aurantiacum]GIJ55685.1 LysR family transcriptional regulator [Virgisporangium aurantiacum]